MFFPTISTFLLPGKCQCQWPSKNQKKKKKKKEEKEKRSKKANTRTTQKAARKS